MTAAVRDLAPGVYAQVVDASDPGVTAVRTDVAAFVGLAERGPLDTPTAIESWVQYRSAFGGPLRGAFMPYAVNAFFENGGRRCVVVRVAAPAVMTRTTAAVQPVNRLRSLVESVVGFAKGAVVEVRQTVKTATAGVQPADRRSSIVTSVDAIRAGDRARLEQLVAGTNVVTYRTVHDADTAGVRLEWDSPLDAAYNLTTPIAIEIEHARPHIVAGVDTTANAIDWADALEPELQLALPFDRLELSSGASAARGWIHDKHGAPLLRFDAASPGIWGNTLQVHMSTVVPMATRTTSAPQPADRKSSLVDRVAGFTVGALVRVFQHDAPASHEFTRVVTAVDPSRDRLSWDAPLGVAIDLTKAISFEVLEVAVTVSERGRLCEAMRGLSMSPSNPRYLPPIIARDSRFVRAVDRRDPAALATSLHDIAAVRPDSQSARLTGGRDGTAALRVANVIGDRASQERRGLRTLELATDVNMVAIPDALVAPEPALRRDPPESPPVDPCCRAAPLPEPPEPPVLVEALPSFAPDEIAAIQQAIIDHCEQERFRFALLDPPRDERDQAGDPDAVLTWRSRFSTRRGALYYPWLLVTDLSASDTPFGTIRAVPPSGHVAGVIANTDLTDGVHVAPANRELSWAQGTTAQIDAALQGVLNPRGVNCLRTLPGRGLRVYAARTLSDEPQWIYVNVRRLMSYIELSIDRSLQWAVFEPNGVLLRHAIAVAISGFLESLASRGALAAAEEDEQAWFVRCDDTTTTRDDEDAGRLLALVGVAPVKPAEFIVLRIGRLEDRWEVSESGETR